MNREPYKHKDINLYKLHEDVAFGRSNGKIIWQPRIGCWIDDKVFNGGQLPQPYTGMTTPELYRELGCSPRIYEYNGCFRRVDDHRVRRFSRKLSDLKTEFIIESPAGKLTCVNKANTSNSGVMPEKWWITCEEDMKVAMWLEEHCSWEWNQEHFDKTYKQWGDLGAPTVFMPRINVQNLYINTMGMEEAIFALYDYPETVEKYFQIMDECHSRLIDVINKSPINIINFGDNIHCGTLPPNLFEKYVLPAYQKRNEKLHKAGKFTHAHWDGDTKAILPYAKETGLDGIEAITPKPQGDVTIKEIKKWLGDKVFLIDGIAAVLFDREFPVEELINQTKEIIELFAPRLILGISDEISSTGDIERIRIVGEMVDEYNASR